MKRLLLVLIVLFFATTSYATHIAGGELYYTYQGPGVAANTDKYLVTMRLFRLCGPVGNNFAGLDGENVTIGIYNNPGLTLLSGVTLIQQFSGNPPEIQNTNGANPCLVPFVSVCYQIGTYQATIELPRTADGYTLSWIRYTRTALDNVSNSSTQMGATFTTKIPGTNQLPIGVNNCPTFAARDTNTVCKASDFILDFSAVDIDGDSLSYKFSPAYDGQNGPAPSPAPPPPSILQPISLNYFPPYSATNPFGTNATINTHTGIISGLAPPNPGKYVVCVTVEEWRNGILINEHRKDFILRVENCSTVKPDAGPDDKTCNGFDFVFQNYSQNPAIIGYNWSFGDGTTSILPTPPHHYTDTGKYLVKLKVTATGGCQDSSAKFVYVFPGFVPNINVVGSCFQQPIQFFDATSTAYGVVNSWKWDFGDLTTIADTARSKDTAWKYASSGTYQISLTSTNSKGCIDTVFKTINVRDKPIINLPFKDTLICSIDTLQLIANATGNFSWTPNYNISNVNSSSPLVYPTDTTTYVLTVNDGGCINKDSIKVNVLTFIKVDAGRDSAICQTDTFRLHPTSYALSYLWTASTGIPVAPVKYPLIQPLVYTKYYVTANLGKCQDRDSVAINPVPYPQVSATNVSPICFGNKIQLHANVVGSNFFWTPTNTLLNPTTLNPIAGPSKTTAYIITATDTIGCPKPVSDTILVEVVPIVSVYAGRDTSVVRNQPLQLLVTTSNIPVTSTYKWTPNIGLNNDTIPNPIATLNITADSIKYKIRVTRPEGCFGEDEIVVRVFSTEPDIFVPTGFTPNHDGKNDILKPITVGITRLDYFRIYNRWGQLVFETNEFEKGWDGTLNGIEQASGTFVFVTQGVDYKGKVVFRKGTCVLIR
jgi:gliding motility-associated-like protein